MYPSRKLLLASVVIAIGLVSLVPVLAQETPPAEKSDVKAKDWGGGGFMPMLWFVELSELNSVLEAHGYGSLSDTVLLMGGGGAGGQLKGFRFGGLGGGGELSSAREAKLAKLALGYGGLTIDYVFAIREPLDLSLGALLGGGSADLKLLDHASESFETAISNPPNTVLSRWFFAVQPRLTLGVHILPWLSLQISGGYMLTFGGSWEQSDRPLPGPPANFNGWTIQATLAFGGMDEEDEEED